MLILRWEEMDSYNAIVNQWCWREATSRGIFHWENLMWHLTVSLAGQSEHWSIACGEIPTAVGRDGSLVMQFLVME